ncbi:MAG: ATP-binding cassette domain-containing protein, partial [Limnochordia bacterium]|nr:ATP-binding cassette domain-containing protein [Limnochordia bacterium]
MSEVAFGYKGKLVIGGVDLQIHEGELIGIAGGHGTGKSTLLKGLLGLVKPL